jgi:hypothetical protein
MTVPYACISLQHTSLHDCPTSALQDVLLETHPINYSHILTCVNTRSHISSNMVVAVYPVVREGAGGTARGERAIGIKRQT